MQRRHVFHRLVLVLLALLILAPAGTVLADQPVRVFLPAPDALIPATNCGFPVSIEITFQKEYFTGFAPNAGRPFEGLITGALHSRVTNLDSGKYLDYNISGPVKIIPHADGSTTFEGMGPSGWPFAGQPNSFPGLPGIFVIKGHWTMEMDAGGNILSMSIIGGKVEDVCAALSE